MKKLLLIFLIVLFVPQLLRAETFAVEVSTGGETINTVEGTLVLPSNVSIKEIFTGHSAVLIWITPPRSEEGTHEISFAGLTPGGFKGKQTLFLVETDSIEGISFENLNGYKNDGRGTKVPLVGNFSQSTLTLDEEIPEPFQIEISHSADLFEGQSFVTFSAQDKNSGIDHYEFATTWFLNPKEADWRETSSPQVLSKQEVFQRIHIRALDRGNNSRTVSTGGPYWYLTLAFGLIIIGCFALFIKRSFSRFS